MTFRTYGAMEGEDGSNLAAQVQAQRVRVAKRLGDVKRVIAVMSGKGGVGKSYISTALAPSAAALERGTIGVLDADLHGPTCGRLLGARGPLRVTDAGVEPAVGYSGVRVFSTDLLLAEGAPLKWKQEAGEGFTSRSLLEAGALRELLGDVVWGELELLIVDLPPGADRLEDLALLVPDLLGAVAITIPSEESRASVQRAMQAAVDIEVRLLGIIENMCGYLCGNCGETGPLFAGDAGAELAAEFGVPFLGRIPFHAPRRTMEPQGAAPPGPRPSLQHVIDATLEIVL